MSKGPWKKGPISPRITLFLRITRAAKETTCSHCKETIPVGTFYIRLAAAYGSKRYWKIHLEGECLSQWAKSKLTQQAEAIQKARGSNPLEEDPYYPKGGTHLDHPNISMDT